MINIKDLSYLNILKNISVNIPKGDITFIVGKNGSGKSTILRCINSLIKDYTGEINIDGKNITDISRKEFARKVCYIPQKTFINYDIEVNEFLTFSRYSHITNRNLDKELINNALELTDMLDLKNRNVRTLSGGEFQKLMLASAIVQDSYYLILDEPGTALDPGAENGFISLLSTIIKDTEKTAIVISHNMNHVLNMADNIIALDDGRIIFKGNSEEFKDNMLSDLYGVEFHVFKNNNGEYICHPTKIL